MKQHYTKWLLFDLLDTPEKKKTQVWKVLSIKGTPLGFIKWFSNWRCYAFFPDEDTIFNSACLNDIIKFIDKLMQKRRSRCLKKS